MEILEPVIILAGGFGTRLRSVVSTLPKPLAPAGNKPFLQYLLEDLIQQGCSHFVLSLYHQAELIQEFAERFKEQTNEEIHIESIVEPEPMGTGGAILFAIEKIGIQGQFFVVNGDTYLPGGLCQLIEASAGIRNAIALVSVKDTSRYGTVERDQKGLVLAFREKENVTRQGIINSGLYKLHRDAFQGVALEPFSIEDQLFSCLVQKKEVYGYPVESSFIDIGVPSDYERFCQHIRKMGFEK
jgi:D-glycero-alpha-D-manno-heptose 1-phosphate guanylyltransferase